MSRADSLPEPDAGDRAYEAYVDAELNGGHVGPEDDEYWDFVPQPARED